MFPREVGIKSNRFERRSDGFQQRTLKKWQVGMTLKTRQDFPRR